MNDFNSESIKFSSEVQAEAARLVRDGLAAPHDAIDAARRIIMERRRARKQPQSLEEAGWR